MHLRSIVLTGILALAAAAGADPPTATLARPGGSFSDRLDLLLVELEVSVSDRRGRPVADLRRDEVGLYRDGSPEKVVYFSRRSAAEIGPRHIVLYVDDRRLRLAHRNRLLPPLGRFTAERLRRGDRFSIAVFDTALRFLAIDSDSETELRSALEALGARPGGAARWNLEARRLRRALQGTAGAAEAAALALQVEDYAARLRADAGYSLAGLGALLEFLPGVTQTGSGNLVILVGDGLPLEPEDDLPIPATAAAGIRVVLEGPEVQSVPTPSVQYLESGPSWPRHPTGRRGDATIWLALWTAAANAGGVTFYPVRPAASGDLLADAGAPGDPYARARGRAGGLDPLHQLAAETGGRLLSSRRFEEALAELSERLDAGYVLGFQLSPRGAGHSHPLEVRARRKDLRIQHRATFVEPAPPVSRTNAGVPLEPPQ